MKLKKVFEVIDSEIKRLNEELILVRLALDQTHSPQMEVNYALRIAALHSEMNALERFALKLSEVKE